MTKPVGECVGRREKEIEKNERQWMDEGKRVTGGEELVK